MANNAKKENRENQEESRNSKTLASFVAYCKANPSQRFWQALRNWAGFGFVYVSDSLLPAGSSNIPMYDTFYWEGRVIDHV
jgi:hypothetical protein